MAVRRKPLQRGSMEVAIKIDRTDMDKRIAEIKAVHGECLACAEKMEAHIRTFRALTESAREQQRDIRKSVSQYKQLQGKKSLNRKNHIENESCLSCSYWFAVSLAAKAQVYDGITQPTKFRVFMPVTTSLEGNGSTVAPFVGYRTDVAKWLSVTPVLQYNMNTEAVTLATWLNVNYQQRFFCLHVRRTI